MRPQAGSTGKPGDDAPCGAGRARTPANRLGLDYRAEAARLGAPVARIIDAHVHVNGPAAACVYREVCDLFGVERVYSQTQLADADGVLEAMAGRVRFVATPSYMDEDRSRTFGEGFIEQLEVWRARYGTGLFKLWSAPRFRDVIEESGLSPEEYWPLDSPWRLRVAEAGAALGMRLMVHVGDPDTWFATRYADVSRYGTKLDQYAPFERLLERVGGECLAAHMGGWPENLEFLSGLMDRHPGLVLDTSATKWMVRELSRHPTEALESFFRRYAGRLLFGSDIVTSDDHLEPTPEAWARFGSQLASSEEEAFDLYASRYWALRTMFETGYEGESNIADPDLVMVDPDAHDAMSAPLLRGRRLGGDVLASLYRGAAEQTIDRWYAEG